jgi:integrase
LTALSRRQSACEELPDTRQQIEFPDGAAFLNRQWVKVRRAAGLPEDLELYRARHDFGTYVPSRTGNLKAVMDEMGHADVKIAMNYLHPELEIVRDAINSRHTLRHTADTTN